MTDTETPYAVRRAVLEDAPAIVAFQQRMALETEAKALDADTVTRGVARLFAHPADGFYLVAEAGDAVVASLMITTEWSDWRDGVFWWIQSVYVIDAFRRRGVYRALYGEVRRLAQAAGDVLGFRLYVERENRIARDTYAALGMTETPYRLYEAPLAPESGS